MTLRTNIVEGESDHAGLHNETNAAVNALLSPLTAPVGTYYFYPVSLVSTGQNSSHGNGVLRLTCGYIPSAMEISTVGAEIITAGTAGCTLRLGVYTCNPDGTVGALAIDAGTIAADAIGVAEATLGDPVTLEKGFYWFGGVVQGAPAAQPNLRAVGGSMALPPTLIIKSSPGPLPGANDIGFGYAQSGVTGALPGTLPSPGGTGGQPVRLFLKATVNAT